MKEIFGRILRYAQIASLFIICGLMIKTALATSFMFGDVSYVRTVVADAGTDNDAFIVSSNRGRVRIGTNASAYISALDAGSALNTPSEFAARGFFSTEVPDGTNITGFGYTDNGTQTRYFCFTNGSRTTCGQGLGYTPSGTNYVWLGGSTMTATNSIAVTLSSFTADNTTLAFNASGAGGTYQLGGRRLLTNTAPTIGTAGTSPSITNSNGTVVFRANVGTGGTASAFTITLPTAANGWVCKCDNFSTPAATALIRQTGVSTTTCVMTQSTIATNTVLAFTASDLIDCIAMPR